MEKSNWIVKNLIKAAIYVAALVIVSTVILSVITHHNQEIEVPDLTNLSVPEAAEMAELAGMRATVIDSVYVRRMQHGAVFSQNPKAGAMVKKGRRVKLTINAVVPKRISMPNLIGYSMRQAKAELASRGLNLGRLIYVDDIATNNVLKQIYNNREIKPGASIESGAEVDLFVGLNPNDNQTYIPDVKGMKYLRALDAVHDNSLNISKVSFDGTVSNYADSLNAVVYRQSPEGSTQLQKMGTGVSLYLSLDPEKAPVKK